MENQTKSEITTERYKHRGGFSAGVITELHKQQIQSAILSAVANGHYYKGLEEDACRAVAFIQRYSDGYASSEIVDTNTGQIYRLCSLPERA